MANIDDFFAKKDKKKKKGFSKANTDVLAKNLEENDRREQKADEKASPLATTEAAKAAFGPPDAADKEPGKANAGSSGVAGTPNDDEWLSYEEEKKDYSGLKIETLKLEPQEAANEDEHEINEEGEKVLKSKNDGGPWNKSKSQNKSSPETSRRDDPSPSSAPGSSSNSSTSVATSANDKSASQQSAATAAPTTSSYKPPHMRGGGGAANSSSTDLAPVRMGGGGGGRRSRAAPDISSEVYFPSLSATEERGKVPGGRSGHDDFEEVRGSGQQQQHGRSSGSHRLTLDNKFDALRD